MANNGNGSGPKHKPANESWGHYIRRTQGDEAYHQYKLNYYKIWRYDAKLSRAGIDHKINIGLEAANMTKHPDSRLAEIMRGSLGSVNRETLIYNDYAVKFNHFMKAHRTETLRVETGEVYQRGPKKGQPKTKNLTLRQILNGIKTGKYKPEMFLNLVNQIKSSAEYRAGGGS